MAPTAQRFRVLIDRVSGTNTRYQKVIEHDPGFTLAIFRLFGSNTAIEVPIHSIAHAISLLGLELVVEKIKHLPVLEELKPDTPPPGIYRCYSRAVHAAWYASLFGNLLGDNTPNEMAVAALFNECAEMALWVYAEDEMAQIQRRIDSGVDRDAAAREVLGFTLGELSLALAKRWHLPPLSIEALQPFAAWNPRAIGAKLAATLAQASDKDWNSKETLELLALTGEYLDLPEGEAAALIHGQAAVLAREIHELPLQVSAISLLQIPTGAPKPKAATAASKPPASPAAPAPQKSAFNPAPGATIPPAQGKTEHQLLANAMHELKGSLGLERVMFAALNRRGDHLKARMIIGAAKDAPLRGFEISLRERSLFSILLTKPKGVWLNRKNRAQYLSLIPGPQQAMLNCDGLFIASLFKGGQPFGLLYADCLDAGLLNSDQFTAFKRLALTLNRQLAQQ